MPPTDIEFAQLTERVATLERAVEFLLAQMGSERPSLSGLPPSSYADVVALKRQGNIIEAIKLYRLKTNTGLAEAKAFVDKL